MDTVEQEYISTLLTALLLFGATAFVVVLLRALITWRYLRKRSMIFLMITPPISGPSLFSMKRLFSVLYVDEFQNFATPSFVQMLSESRKYKVFLHMAEQSTSQQKDQRMVDIILANVGTIVCFRTGNPHDEWMLLPLFRPYIETGEIANLPAYNFYARLSSLKAQEPVSGQTIVPTEMGSKSIAEKVIATSRQNYAVAANLTQK